MSASESQNCFTCKHRINALCLQEMKTIQDGYATCNQYVYTPSVDCFCSSYIAYEKRLQVHA